MMPESYNMTLDVWTEKKEPSGIQSRVCTVSEVADRISGILSDPGLSGIWVRGEITNYNHHRSGHRYFSLSDTESGKNAILECKMWKGYAKHIRFTPANGQCIEAYGSIENYIPHGAYSLIVTQMRPAGIGETFLLVERWKKELQAEGLFAQEKKKNLPSYPETIGVVTSSTGAVLHDIRNVLSCRYPINVLLAPTAVQGEGVHTEIIQALHSLDGRVDVIIIARGGGSFLDLFPFNHPDLVRAIANCTTPVVSAIGHEVDVTLSDLAADRRASTPSHAAEICVPDRNQELHNLRIQAGILNRSLLRRRENACRDLNIIRERLSLQGMKQKMNAKHQELVDLSDKINQNQRMHIHNHHMTVREQKARIHAKSPLRILIHEIPERRRYLMAQKERLASDLSMRLREERSELVSIQKLLCTVHPRMLLSRGYCIVRKGDEFVRSISSLKKEDIMQVIFSDGSADARVQEIQRNEKI